MTELNITELSDGLVFKVGQKPSVTNAILSGLAAAVFSDLAASFMFGRIGSAALAILAGACAILYSRRVRRFELKVTRLEFTAVGRVGDNFGQFRAVSTYDVQRLEYQSDTTGPETARHPGGLYAAVRGKSVCLLPGIDEAQTASVIDHVEARFPDLRTRWSGQSAFGKNFVQLGIDTDNR